MQNALTSETSGKVVFDSKLEGVPGGVTLAAADLTKTSVAAGTPVGKDSNGLFHVVKTAKAQASATNVAVDYKVLKGHNFAVGKFLSTGTLKKAYAITVITTSNADYDTLTVGTTLGVAVAAGDVFIEATAEATGNTSAFKYTPFGLTGTDVEIEANGNHLVDVVVRGSVKESLIAPIHADIKTAIPLIRFV